MTWWVLGTPVRRFVFASYRHSAQRSSVANCHTPQVQGSAANSVPIRLCGEQYVGSSKNAATSVVVALRYLILFDLGFMAESQATAPDQLPDLSVGSVQKVKRLATVGCALLTSPTPDLTEVTSKAYG